MMSSGHPRLRSQGPAKQATAQELVGGDVAVEPWYKARGGKLVTVLLVLLFVAVAALSVALLILQVRQDEPDGDDLGILQLIDSQRIALGSTLAIPVVGDQDVILIVVRNNDDLEVLNITVFITLTSAARRRSPVDLAVICPPLYVDNVVPSLDSHRSVTCRALYTLTADDIVNGNTLHTASAAEGISASDVTMSVVATPGASKLEINNIDIPEGAVFAVPGPSGTLSVVASTCNNTDPPTTLVCGPSNELQLLFCDLNSEMHQVFLPCDPPSRS